MKKSKPYICHVNQRLLGKDTLAANFFGIILTADTLNDVDINHELIHTAQMKEMLYIFFYIWYGIEWLILFIKYHDWTKAYFNVRFEKEAYKHQGELDYLKHRKRFNDFREKLKWTCYPGK